MSVSKNEKTKKWEFRAHYTDLKGNDKIKHKSGFSTKKEALQAEAEYIKQRDLGHTEACNMKLSELDELFIQDYRHHVKESTLVSHKERMRTILAQIDKRIDKITANDIRAWQNSLLDNGISPQYVHAQRKEVAKVLDFGMEYYGLKKNVIKATHFDPKRSDTKEEVLHFYTYDEFKKLDKVMPYTEVCDFIRFLYWTGCRRGEAMAITWEDIKNNKIHVYKSVTYKRIDKRNIYNITTPKTKGSNRYINIPNQLKRVLERIYKANKDIYGFNDKCFVFGTTRPLPPETIRANFHRYTDKAELPRIRIHDLRHSHASLLFGLGVDVSYISQRLGHSDISTTMRVYVHMLPEKEDEALAALNKL